MAEKPEDLNLPASAINRIVKEALPDGVNVSKETKTAIARAASIFILYATTCANNFAIKSKRKTITASDIFQALQDMELEEFIPELKECLEVHKQDQKEKKEAAADRKKKQAAAAAASTISEDPLNPSDTVLSTTSHGTVAETDTGACDEQMIVETCAEEGADIQQAS